MIGGFVCLEQFRFWNLLRVPGPNRGGWLDERVHGPGSRVVLHRFPSGEECCRERAGNAKPAPAVLWELDSIQKERPALTQRDGIEMMVPWRIGLFATHRGDLPQDRVDHSARPDADVSLRPADRFIQHGVGRHSIEQQQLGCPSQQDRSHTRLKLVTLVAAHRLKDVLERTPTPDRVVRDGMCK